MIKNSIYTNRYLSNFILTYSFKEDIVNQESKIRQVHQLTMDETKPFFGIKGNYGLYATREWWNSIDKGLIKLEIHIGLIIKTFKSGQDNIDKDNAFTFVSSIDGKCYNESIYCFNNANYPFFKSGHFVCIVYALDELKTSTDNNIQYSKTVLEMSVTENKYYTVY